MEAFVFRKSEHLALSVLSYVLHLNPDSVFILSSYVFLVYSQLSSFETTSVYLSTRLFSINYPYISSISNLLLISNIVCILYNMHRTPVYKKTAGHTQDNKYLGLQDQAFEKMIFLDYLSLRLAQPLICYYRMRQQ